MHHTSVENMKCRSKEHVSLCWKKDWAHALMFCFVFEVAKKVAYISRTSTCNRWEVAIVPIFTAVGIVLWENTDVILWQTVVTFSVWDSEWFSCSGCVPNFLSEWHNLVRQIIQMDSFTRRLHVKWWLIWSGNPSWITWTLPCREVCFAL